MNVNDIKAKVGGPLEFWFHVHMQDAGISLRLNNAEKMTSDLIKALEVFMVMETH